MCFSVSNQLSARLCSPLKFSQTGTQFFEIFLDTTIKTTLNYVHKTCQLKIIDPLGATSPWSRSYQQSLSCKHAHMIVNTIVGAIIHHYRILHYFSRLLHSWNMVCKVQCAVENKKQHGLSSVRNIEHYTGIFMLRITNQRKQTKLQTNHSSLISV